MARYMKVMNTKNPAARRNTMSALGWGLSSVAAWMLLVLVAFVATAFLSGFLGTLLEYSQETINRVASNMCGVISIVGLVGIPVAFAHGVWRRDQARWHARFRDIQNGGAK